MRTIGIGDKVSIYFESQQAIHHATVIHTPAATGDCWYVEDGYGYMYAVQNFAYMVKEKVLDN